LIDKSNSARSNGQRMLNSDEKNDEDDDDLQVLKENINRVPPHYIAVIKCTAAEDSFVESSRVAGLKYLARGELQDGGLQHHPISIQVLRFLISNYKFTCKQREAVNVNF